LSSKQSKISTDVEAKAQLQDQTPDPTNNLVTPAIEAGKRPFQTATFAIIVAVVAVVAAAAVVAAGKEMATDVELHRREEVLNLTVDRLRRRKGMFELVQNSLQP
jgi:hypothetical protein